MASRCVDGDEQRGVADSLVGGLGLLEDRVAAGPVVA